MLGVFVHAQTTYTNSAVWVLASFQRGGISESRRIRPQNALQKTKSTWKNKIGNPTTTFAVQNKRCLVPRGTLRITRNTLQSNVLRCTTNKYKRNRVIPRSQICVAPESQRNKCGLGIDYAYALFRTRFLLQRGTHGAKRNVWFNGRQLRLPNHIIAKSQASLIRKPFIA